MRIFNTYYELGESFYALCEPEPVTNPSLFLWNTELAEFIGLPVALTSNQEMLAQVFSGNTKLDNSKPLATAYAGHQFGYFNPLLGDGRAHLLGDVKAKDGALYDIQLKGSGPTPFSRGGDGRCALGPAIREFIMSEALYALGVPTTRTLAVVTTGEPVYRDTVLPGAVVTRVASSHLRVGTFEYFRAKGNIEAIKRLCDYAITRHYPELHNHKANKYLALIEVVMERQIQLVCHWMRIGFIHGVMNTDNTAISGETIDYGPCAMMGIYNPQTVFSSIDTHGRYCFGNQPAIAQWNLSRFAECLLPLIDANESAAIEKVTPLISGFSEKFKNAFMKMMSLKLGFQKFDSADEQLIADFLQLLKSKALDYTLIFDLLTKSFDSVAIQTELKTELGQVYELWRQRIAAQNEGNHQVQERMRCQNPVVIPRNHHVEAVIAECINSGSADAAELFLKVLRSPYKETEHSHLYQGLPEDGDSGYQTFCGT